VDECIITYGGQSYLLEVFSFNVAQNIHQQPIYYTQYNPVFNATLSINVNISFKQSSALYCFLNSYNNHLVHSFSISSVKFDMEFRSSIYNKLSFYGCVLENNFISYSMNNVNNTVDCSITADHYINHMLTDEEHLRKERKEKLNEIFDGEL
jgi:hypothetical protein